MQTGRGNLKLLTAPGCAWYGMYLNADGRQIARLVFDSNVGSGYGPQLSGLVNGVEFRWTLPHLSWGTAYRFRRVPGVMRLYKLQQTVRVGLDGRFGWFGSNKRGY